MDPTALPRMLHELHYRCSKLPLLPAQLKQFAGFVHEVIREDSVDKDLTALVLDCDSVLETARQHVVHCEEVAAAVREWRKLALTHCS